MIKLKTKEDIENLRIGGRILAEAREDVLAAMKAGVSTQELDDIAKSAIEKRDGKSWFLGYRPEGAPDAYPSATCISINEEIVHGFPGERKLELGDIVSLDMGVLYKGLYTDSAVTVGIGQIDKASQELLRVTQEALFVGIEAAVLGGKVGDIGAAIEGYARPYGYGIFRELVGHGVGYAPHEEPFVPNFGKAGTGPDLVEGLVIAIEPMFAIGNRQVKPARNGHTYITVDGSRSAHFEHTIAITKEGPKILTDL